MNNNPNELPETRQANMLNFAALGTARFGFGITTAFAVLAAVTGQIVPAVIFTASLLPQAGLCWLSSRHCQAQADTPQPEAVEYAQKRCKDAFRRIVAPAVVIGASFLAVNIADPNPEPVKFATLVPMK